MTVFTNEDRDDFFSKMREAIVECTRHELVHCACAPEDTKFPWKQRGEKVEEADMQAFVEERAAAAYHIFRAGEARLCALALVVKESVCRESS